MSTLLSHWPLLLVALPVYAVHETWPGAWWGAKPLAAILGFMAMLWILRAALEAHEIGHETLLFPLPWYFPLITFALPYALLIMAWPNAPGIYQALAFFSGFPFAWASIELIVPKPKTTWWCRNCGCKARVDKDTAPPEEECHKDGKPTGRAHDWEYRGSQVHPQEVQEQ
jgi:hypothetical protein